MYEEYSLIASSVGAVSDHQRRLIVPAKQNFEVLIKEGWGVIERDFDETAFLQWRKTAVEYLTETLGPDHYYTKHFSNKVLHAEAVGVLSGTGLLSAAREQIINGDCQLRGTLAM
jgi:hypothetical protein